VDPTIPQRIRRLRREREISGRAMAKKLGISPSYYAELEKGTKRLSGEHIKTIAEILDVSADYLLGVEDELSNEKSYNIKELIEDGTEGFKQFHWDGVPLTPEDLQKTKEILEYILRKKLEQEEGK